MHAERRHQRKRAREGLCERAIKVRIALSSCMQCDTHLYEGCELCQCSCLLAFRRLPVACKCGPCARRCANMQEVLDARRKAVSSLAALQGLIAPRLRNGATLSAVRESCLASGQLAADGTLQVPNDSDVIVAGVADSLPNVDMPVFVQRYFLAALSIVQQNNAKGGAAGREDKQMRIEPTSGNHDVRICM